MNPKIIKNYTENGLEQFISIESQHFSINSIFK